MRMAFLFFAFLLYFGAIAQKKETYYDFFWQPCAAENARYYSIVQKTDSGWLQSDYFISSGKLQMQALYEDEACKIKNGNCVYFHYNGVPSIVGRFVHGKQDGICVSYFSNGMMSDSALFREGKVVDKRFRWHRNGYIADSITRVNDSTEVQVGWFDNGALAYAGYLVLGKQDGKWKYYHHNGELSSVEIYKKGSRNSAEYFDEKGQQLSDTSSVNREAGFKGGQKAWIKYLEKNLYWPANLQFTTAAAVTVGVDFLIDEDGKLVDVQVSLPFHPEFDRIALNVIKKSPAWLPAISHNRKIKTYMRQPVTFQQPDW